MSSEYEAGVDAAWSASYVNSVDSGSASISEISKVDSMIYYVSGNRGYLLIRVVCVEVQ